MLLLCTTFFCLQFSILYSYPLDEREDDFTTVTPDTETLVEPQDQWRLRSLKDEIALVDSNKSKT